jgi:hypothetical protein
MKRYLAFLLIVSLPALSCKEKKPGDPQPTDGKYEAEHALMSSTNSVMTTISGFSGTGYVGGFYNASDYVTFELENIVAGRFDLLIGYSTSNYGAKVCNVDIVAMDIYPGENQHSSQYYEFNRVKEKFEGRKIIALSECGSVPDPVQMKQYGDVWSWFMPWNGDFTRADKHNGAAWWNKFFSYSYVITRDKMPNLH